MRLSIRFTTMCRRHFDPITSMTVRSITSVTFTSMCRRHFDPMTSMTVRSITSITFTTMCRRLFDPIPSMTVRFRRKWTERCLDGLCSCDQTVA